jgi:predicted acetyltransferase
MAEIDRSLAAFDGDRIVGAAAAYSFSLTVPGGSLPMAGVTGVGVQPTHRRRGILTHLMRRQLDDVRERGEPLAGLWASEGAIYQRFGYGLAALNASFEIARAKTAFNREVRWEGSLRLIEKEEALGLMPGICEPIVASSPGMYPRTPAQWTHDFADLPSHRNGRGPLSFAVYEEAGTPMGYLVYRTKLDWPQGTPSSTLFIRELFAQTPQARAALYRFAFDHDLMGTTEAWPVAPDEPIFHLLAHPRALRLHVGDGLWLRLVDLPPALEGRRYADEGRVVFEVRDDFCPWNEGRFELDASDGSATCRPTDRPADLLLEANDLAAVYLGGPSFRVLSRAGRVVEETPGALARADRMFGWDPAPWCPFLF